jgi:hypothetical protein
LLCKTYTSEGEVMHQLYDAFIVAWDNYQAMQHAHLDCLATEVQPDMERLEFERARLSTDLQNHLTALLYQLHTAVPEPVLLDVLRARLAALQEDDAVLAERLQAYRATLEQHRAQVHKGQRALVGYGSLVTPLSPRLVDTSG